MEINISCGDLVDRSSQNKVLVPDNVKLCIAKLFLQFGFTMLENSDVEAIHCMTLNAIFSTFIG